MVPDSGEKVAGSTKAVDPLVETKSQFGVVRKAEVKKRSPIVLERKVANAVVVVVPESGRQVMKQAK